MKGSIKTNFKIINILMVVIVYITTIALYGKVIDKQNIFSLKNLLILLVFVSISFIINSILVKMVTLPLKKIEKNMRLVANGKISEPKRLEEYAKLKEIDDFIDA